MPSNQFSAVYRFVFVAIVSIAMLIVDHRTATFEPSRSALSAMAQPFYWVLDVPQNIGQFFVEYWPNRILANRYDELQFENLRISAELQKFHALNAENERLLRLVSASQSRSSEVELLADVINVNIDTFNQKIVIDRGLEANVFLGQAVIDAVGLLGQVSIVGKGSSRVTLITDNTHSAPVEVRRNGLQALVQGRGTNSIGIASLSVPFLSFQADIRVGDVLVTSGLGGVFPANHPVATVTDIQAIPGEPFLLIEANPISEMSKLEHVLLLKETHLRLDAIDEAEDGDELAE